MKLNNKGFKKISAALNCFLRKVGDFCKPCFNGFQGLTKEKGEKYKGYWQFQSLLYWISGINGRSPKRSRRAARFQSLLYWISGINHCGNIRKLLPR